MNTGNLAVTRIPRALNPRMLRLITQGPSPAQLRKGRAKACWNALVTTAMSAYRYGHTQDTWQDVLTSYVGGLADLHRADEHGRKRTRLAVQKDLDKAWERAVRAIDDAGEHWNATEAAAEAQGRSWALQDAIADPAVPLTDAQRQVLAYAASIAVARQTTHVTMPRREVADATGLTQKIVRAALGRVHQLGLLDLLDPGRPSGPQTSAAARSAALYGLPDAEEITRRAELARTTETVRATRTAEVEPLAREVSRKRADEILATVSGRVEPGSPDERGVNPSCGPIDHTLNSHVGPSTERAHRDQDGPTGTALVGPSSNAVVRRRAGRRFGVIDGGER